ncbi:hypothetical protein DOV67_07965 [Salmonella enterica subsp. enterica serovar Java]|uniref:Uncharacterized protein n=2 Tax=Salmonella enterica I TaxID=59201 RepID=A0A3Y9C6K7_SALEB|nr:hypothetical protein [Salmonella enterica subsp. enterica serovar Java]EAB8479595.1 hypothetical protein [Salmonella enterica subsp. enterica serovar Java]EBR8571507.1 hypothetical protein [Salmonella enterica subsp. enterica serovar Java]ECS8432508.1 hypothetical protein [Salmonella enterica]
MFINQCTVKHCSANSISLTIPSKNHFHSITPSQDRKGAIIGAKIKNKIIKFIKINLLIKFYTFFTGMGILRCLSDLITVRQTARSPLCTTGIHSC